MCCKFYCRWRVTCSGLAAFGQRLLRQCMPSSCCRFRCSALWPAVSSFCRQYLFLYITASSVVALWQLGVALVAVYKAMVIFFSWCRYIVLPVTNSLPHPCNAARFQVPSAIFFLVFLFLPAPSCAVQACLKPGSLHQRGHHVYRLEKRHIPQQTYR